MNGWLVGWDMDNGVRSAGLSFGFMPANATVEQVLDITGDGTDDILWRAPNGDVAYLEVDDHMLDIHQLGNVSTGWDLM